MLIAHSISAISTSICARPMWWRRNSSSSIPRRWPEIFQVGEDAMKQRRIGSALIASCLLLFIVPGRAASPPPDIDAYVAHAMQIFGVPGLSLAIVENGGTVLAKGYGVRKVGTPQPVDEHTAFPIGSESKAFTSAALAIL